VQLSSFHELGLADPLRRALDTENHVAPTPIQAQAIPHLLEGRDLLGVAQTGTGKTAAFVLPILHRLAEEKANLEPRMVRALILAPTRELVVQIGERARAYGRHLHLRHATILGGVGLQPQIRSLSRGVDMLIATPGRLLDLVAQRHVRLDKVSHLVLDEADRMLDMGFIRDVRRIVALLPRVRQSLLFSATMPGDVEALANDILHMPIRVDVAPQTVTADRIEQRVFFVDTAGKRKLLTGLLSDPAMSRVIVFTRTKHGADRVAEQLEKSGIMAEAIHGNKSQGARQRALDEFRSGRSRVLVATDIAARGIDVPDISHVINYEIPQDAESYVHRIGRTARAGAEGIALSFCDNSERAYLRDIEKLTRNRLTVAGGDPGPAPSHRPQPHRTQARAHTHAPAHAHTHVPVHAANRPHAHTPKPNRTPAPVAAPAPASAPAPAPAPAHSAPRARPAAQHQNRGPAPAPAGRAKQRKPFRSPNRAKTSKQMTGG
jgi:ATP-dependent RNA helicase RhlE